MFKTSPDFGHFQPNFRRYSSMFGFPVFDFKFWLPSFCFQSLTSLIVVSRFGFPFPNQKRMKNHLYIPSGVVQYRPELWKSGRMNTTGLNILVQTWTRGSIIWVRGFIISNMCSLAAAGSDSSMEFAVYFMWKMDPIGNATYFSNAFNSGPWQHH